MFILSILLFFGVESFIDFTQLLKKIKQIQNKKNVFKKSVKEKVLKKEKSVQNQTLVRKKCSKGKKSAQNKNKSVQNKNKVLKITTKQENIDA